MAATQHSFRFDPWHRKPLVLFGQQAADEAPHEQQHRHLTLPDLIGLGVGGTVGSGIFVLVGQIAATTSGRATWCSFALAGVAAITSGAGAFCELSSRMPAAGSTYQYAHAVWGQGAAVVAAACLTLEYAVAGAAVARTWGDKLIRLVLLIVADDDNEDDVVCESSKYSWLLCPWGGLLNLPAALVSAACTAVLLRGVQQAKVVTNVTTCIKMGLVLFMILAGFWLSWFRPPVAAATSVVVWAPRGVAGIFRGATSSFFGYLGYDEVVCVAGEVIHPVRDMPRAVLGTLAIVTLTYIAAAMALCYMVDDPANLSPTSGFPSAFSMRHVEWAAELAAWGEVVTLPVVVLISLLAQPRLTYSMAVDGLLPAVFAFQDNATGNLTSGTWIAGTAMTVTAAFVPFTYLDDLISAGILVAFSLTNASLVVLRLESPNGLVEQCLMLYNGLCFVSALLWTHTGVFVGQPIVAVISLVLTVFCVPYMAINCPPAAQFGASLLCGQNRGLAVNEHEFFKTPCVPYFPCFAMAINWYLIGQLEATSLLLLLVYLGAAILLYWVCGTSCRSRGLSRWTRKQSYHSIELSDKDNDSKVTMQHALGKTTLRVLGGAISMENLSGLHEQDSPYLNEADMASHAT
jgi:basic amino acid/polyamine antiporter, APA family